MHLTNKLEETGVFEVTGFLERRVLSRYDVNTLGEGGAFDLLTQTCLQSTDPNLVNLQT